MRRLKRLSCAVARTQSNASPPVRTRSRPDRRPCRGQRHARRFTCASGRLFTAAWPHADDEERLRSSEGNLAGLLPLRGASRAVSNGGGARQLLGSASATRTWPRPSLRIFPQATLRRDTGSPAAPSRRRVCHKSMP
jgi:hypothetical protein